MAISVPFTTLSEGPTEQWNEDAASAVVVFQCAWDDHYVLMKDLRGWSRYVGNQIIRKPPEPYPFSPNLACISIDNVQPYGIGYPHPSGLFTRREARVTARFGPLPYDTTGEKNGQPYTSVTFGVAGEFQTLPGTTYRFDDGKPTNTPIGRVVVQIEINVTRYLMPFLPVLECAAVAGCVNNAPYRIGNFAFDTGTLLFSGGSSQLSVDSEGKSSDQVDYKFTFRAIPWNYFLHPSRSGGYQVVTDGTGAPVYPPGDFRVLP